MNINTGEGSRSVTSQTQGNLNTVLSSLGLAAGLMGGGLNLFGGNKSNYANGDSNPDARFVTKGEMNLVQELMQKDQALAAKDAQIALKDSEAYTDKKLVEVTQYLDGKLTRLSEKVDANKDAQNAINAQQMANNATMISAIDVLKSQQAQLMGVTKLFIPSSNVCQSQCGCGCGCNQ